VSYAAGVRILQDGVDGTSMVPWTDRLSAAEIEAVVHYVRSLYDGDNP